MSPRTEAVVVQMLPIAPILIPLGIHFILLNFVFLFGWLRTTYFYSHLIFVGVGVWACHAKTEILPVVIFIGVVVSTILFDIIQLGLDFPGQQAVNGRGDTTSARTWQFSAAMCIINLLLKPVTVALAAIALFIRAGGTIKGLGGSKDDSYSDMNASNGQGTSE